MNAPNQGTSSSSPADPPLKRKRGRPRKDENVVAQVESTPPLPGSDSIARSKPVGSSTTTTAAVSPEMVGQLVTGVIEGTFDGGYLLKAKVADSDTHLRGVVFLPGRFMPITATSDVAPQAKMYKRTDMAIPVPNPPAHLPAYVPTIEQSNKQLFEHRNLAPTIQDHKLPSALQPSIPMVCDGQSPSSMFPLCTAAGPSLVGKPMFLQPPGLVSGPGNQSQPATVAPQLGLGKIGEREKLLQEFEESIRKGPVVPVVINVEAVEKSKSVPPLPPCLQVLPVTETVKPEVQHQNPGHGLELNELAPDGVPGRSIETNGTPVISEPEIASSEKQDSAEKATTLKLDVKTTDSSDQAPDLIWRPSNHSATTSQSAPSTVLPVEQCLLQKMNETQSNIFSDATDIRKAESELVPVVTSLLATTFEKEALAPPLESNVATDGPVLPRTSEPSFCSPLVAANSIDCNIKDAIPPAES